LIPKNTDPTPDPPSSHRPHSGDPLFFPRRFADHYPLLAHNQFMMPFSAELSQEKPPSAATGMYANVTKE
jgi:hypothetical protein